MPRPLLSTKKSSLTTDVLNVVDAAGNLVVDAADNQVVVSAKRQLVVQRTTPLITARASLSQKKAPLTR